MGWALGNSDDADLEIMTAHYPNLHLISVPQVGTQEAQINFNGQWDATTPEIAKNFSAVGYLFGRRLHLALGVPVVPDEKRILDTLSMVPIDDSTHLASLLCRKSL